MPFGVGGIVDKEMMDTMYNRFSCSCRKLFTVKRGYSKSSYDEK